MPGKRPYRLGKRQASVDATKRRILDAAVAEYTASGITDTSMQAVARRADVAPGTVLYHYPQPDDLAEAVIARWVVDMEAPSPDLIDPDHPIEARLRKLVEEVYRLYERSEDAYRIYLKSPGHPVMGKYEAWWYQNVSEMMARALGERVEDREVATVVSVLIDPGFRGTLISRGVEPERAIDIATEMAVDRLRR